MRENSTDLLSEVKFGTVPSGWRLVPLRDIVLTASYGLNNPVDEIGNCSILGMRNIQDGRLDLTNMSRVRATDADMASCKLSRGNLLVNRTNSIDLVGKTAVVDEDIPHVFASYLVRLIVDENEADPWYVNAWLNSRATQALIRKLATMAVGQANLNISAFQKYCLVPLPSLPQQRRIAEVLKTSDKAIEKMDRLLAAKSKALDHWSLMLLSGRKRLGSKRSNWQSVVLTDVTSEATSRNGGSLGGDVVMGVNKSLGMIPMKDHVRAADLSRYKIVAPEAFAYNPMRLNIGSIAQNLHGREVLVSPDYVAFAAQPDALLPAYFDHLRRSWLWSRFVKTAGSGGVRVRIYYDDLADFVFELPPLPEQRRIVDVLDTGRREIALLEAQRDALAKQKRGLMQKLLTGEWPVSVPTTKEAAE